MYHLFEEVHEMPEEKEVRKGKLKGEVRGYVGREYTRGLSPARVYVKIAVPGKRKKPRIYSPYVEKDMLRLRDDFPDLYAMLHEIGLLEPKAVNEYGEFELDVPLLQMGYIVSAHVEDKDYDHTDKMGDDGSGKAEVIWSKDILDTEGLTLDGIIIPVKDRWWKVSKGTRKGDPKTDPAKTPPGIMSEEDRRAMRDYLKHKGEE